MLNLVDCYICIRKAGIADNGKLSFDTLLLQQGKIAIVFTMIAWRING